MHLRLILSLFLCAMLAACGTAAAPQAAPTAAPAPAATAASTAAVAAPTTTPPQGPPAGVGGTTALRLEPIATGFAHPTHITGAGDGSGRLFVVEQGGTIRVLRDGQALEQPFLDITALVGSSGNEQGLLSVAFHPDYERNGLFFVDYTDRQGDTVVARYRVSDDPDSADPASATTILTVAQPATNHNGGQLKFGPDGYLYIGMGDGGQAGDPWGNAQNRAVLLGKLLRIDVDSGEPYAIPPDNPFVGQSDARPEIWAYGLRNPWRFSFDRDTNDLYIADVGQNAYEEVDFQPANSQGGENYGWDLMEGASCYPDDVSCSEEGLVQPVATYGREDGCSITGGYVYRGSAFPQLAGTYIYADYCSGNFWTLRRENGAWQSTKVLQAGVSITTFGEDEAGELFAADRESGTIFRVGGELERR